MNRRNLTNGPYSQGELHALGLSEFGEDLLIDRSVSFYQPEYIHIGSHVRIDANVVLSASPKGLIIGDHVHLAVGVILLGNERIEISDFCGLSTYVSVFSSNDDYSGGWLTNPTVPQQFRRVKTAPVILRKHVIVGSQSVILPGATIGLGASVGALSLVNKSIPDFMVVTGNPLRKVGYRDRGILDKENEFLSTTKEIGETE